MLTFEIIEQLLLVVTGQTRGTRRPLWTLESLRPIQRRRDLLVALADSLNGTLMTPAGLTRFELEDHRIDGVVDDDGRCDLIAELKATVREIDYWADDCDQTSPTAFQCLYNESERLAAMCRLVTAEQT